MQREVFDDEVARMIQGVGSANEDEFIMALESLFHRGHTSGVDIAVGAVLAVTLLLDVKENEREMEEIVRRLGFSN